MNYVNNASLLSESEFQWVSDYVAHLFDPTHKSKPSVDSPDALYALSYIKHLVTGEPLPPRSLSDTEYLEIVLKRIPTDDTQLVTLCSKYQGFQGYVYFLDIHKKVSEISKVDCMKLLIELAHLSRVRLVCGKTTYQVKVYLRF